MPRKNSRRKRSSRPRRGGGYLTDKLSGAWSSIKSSLPWSENKLNSGYGSYSTPAAGASFDSNMNSVPAASASVDSNMNSVPAASTSFDSNMSSMPAASTSFDSNMTSMPAAGSYDSVGGRKRKRSRTMKRGGMPVPYSPSVWGDQSKFPQAVGGKRRKTRRMRKTHRMRKTRK